MKYKLLGRSGLRVSELCFGTMTFGEDWGWGAPLETCETMLNRFEAVGGNFIDTACNYTNGSSERILGQLLEGRRERFVLATKYTLSTNPTDPNASGNQRKNMMQTVEASLKRLRADYIDLLWVHAWDKMTPVDEVMRGLDDLVRAGKVLYVGISDAPAWWIARANTIAELRGWTPFVGLQIEYSLVQRTPERELLPMARELDLAVTPWSPLGGGVLTGKYNQGRNGVNGRLAEGDWGKSIITERNLAIAAEVVSIAHQIGRSPAQVALAWIRQQGQQMIPIIGASKLHQFEDNLKSLELILDEKQLAQLNDTSQIELGFPHDMLNSPMVKFLVYGNHRASIENHRD